MKLPGGLGHLTYCTNIHPGESWEEVERNVRTHVPAVKAAVSARAPFGVGLRLSARAARALSDPEALATFGRFLDDAGLYVFTINGFPYGAFHGQPVKENVYRPDWQEDERVAYSDELARLLVKLLPEGLEGSVSTVPACFRERGSLSVAGAQVAARVRQHALTLVHLAEQSGRTIGLALEPEPACAIETIAETLSFFQEHLLCRDSLVDFGRAAGLSPAKAEEALRRHVGVCLDTCHAAVEFEHPEEAPDALLAAGVRILKLQVTAGLRVSEPDDRARAALRRFAEGVYLHQTVVRRGDALTRFVDLPEALASLPSAVPEEEWRVHFHVPLFREELPPFQNTQAFVTALLARHARAPFTQHLEVETYTWDVLPEEYRREPVVEAISRELTWTLNRLGASRP